MANISEGLLLGLGNPLLDLSACVDCDDKTLEKFSLKPNNAVLYDESLHNGLFEHMEQNYEIIYTAGGAVQNTMRVAQWIIGVPKCATFMGAIGNDKYGEIMEKEAKDEGVNVVYMRDNVTPTGKCACLISDSGKNRSLCAYLGASQNFRKQHLLENFEYIKAAKYFYTSGFHAVVSVDSILELATHALTNDGKVFCVNLSAPYICEFYSDKLFQILPYIDILFGNETEALAFAKIKNWGIIDTKEIANRIANEPSKRTNGRIVVITQGKDNLVVAKTHENVTEFEVTKLSDDEIVDTNGAGDAFVGGFLAMYIQSEPLDVCIKCGIYAATEVIKLDGCTFPKECRFKK